MALNHSSHLRLVYSDNPSFIPPEEMPLPLPVMLQGEPFLLRFDFVLELIQPRAARELVRDPSVVQEGFHQCVQQMPLVIGRVLRTCNLRAIRPHTAGQSRDFRIFLQMWQTPGRVMTSGEELGRYWQMQVARLGAIPRGFANLDWEAKPAFYPVMPLGDDVPEWLDRELTMNDHIYHREPFV